MLTLLTDDQRSFAFVAGLLSQSRYKSKLWVVMVVVMLDFKGIKSIPAGFSR
jgi:hypothetical protein